MGISAYIQLGQDAFLMWPQLGYSCSAVAFPYRSNHTLLAEPLDQRIQGAETLKEWLVS